MPTTSKLTPTLEQAPYNIEHLIIVDMNPHKRRII